MIICNNQNVCTSYAEQSNNQPSICRMVPIIDGDEMIRKWYNKQMARYEQCIGINLNRQNQNYTTINGRSISIGIFPIWYMSYNNQPAGWIIREWYNKQMARYEQCIGINLNRQNQNYTTINGRSISMGIFPIWFMSKYFELNKTTYNDAIQ